MGRIHVPNAQDETPSTVTTEHDVAPDEAPNAPEARTLVITLTTAPEIHVRPREWPTVAAVILEREFTLWMKVRAHADGRAIVYGRRVGGFTIRGGWLVDAAAGADGIDSAILKLARLLNASMSLAHALSQAGRRATP